LPDDTVVAHPPTVTVTGRPSRITKEGQTFEIDVGQYISFGKEKALFPFTGAVPKNGRWTENNRPFPNLSNPKYLSVTGFLTVTPPSESEEALKRFTVEMDSIHFLGPAPAPFGHPKSMLVSLVYHASLTFHSPAPGAPTPKGKRKAVLDFYETPTKKTK
jgi:hypothetical protein